MSITVNEATPLASIVSEIVVRLMGLPHDAALSFRFATDKELYPSKHGERRDLRVGVRIGDRTWAYYLDVSPNRRRDPQGMAIELERIATLAQQAVEDILKEI